MAVFTKHGKLDMATLAHGDEVIPRSKQDKANLRLVKRIYEEVLGPIDSGAVDALFDPSYIQHNPNAATGSQGLKEMLDRAKVKYPKAEHRVKRLLVDGDLVAAHVHVVFNPGDAGFAVVDIFRIANGRIAEHWDVMQPITASTKNANGRF
jgi:predicted SnoaL-like aldol condensation-catalyzing enzyme